MESLVPAEPQSRDDELVRLVVLQITKKANLTNCKCSPDFIAEYCGASLSQWLPAASCKCCIFIEFEQRSGNKFMVYLHLGACESPNIDPHAYVVMIRTMVQAESRIDVISPILGVPPSPNVEMTKSKLKLGKDLIITKSGDVTFRDTPTMYKPANGLPLVNKGDPIVCVRLYRVSFTIKPDYNEIVLYSNSVVMSNIFTSIKNDMESLSALSKHTTTRRPVLLLMGHSGVGKSSFINSAKACDDHGGSSRTLRYSPYAPVGQSRSTWTKAFHTYDLNTINAIIMDMPGIEKFRIACNTPLSTDNEWKKYVQMAVDGEYPNEYSLSDLVAQTPPTNGINIDAVVFIIAQDKVPDTLDGTLGDDALTMLQTVKDACYNCKNGEIPLIVVMTQIDKVLDTCGSTLEGRRRAATTIHAQIDTLKRCAALERANILPTANLHSNGALNEDLVIQFAVVMKQIVRIIACSVKGKLEGRLLRLDR